MSKEDKMTKNYAPKHLSTIENAGNVDSTVEAHVSYSPRHMAAHKPTKLVRRVILTVVCAILPAAILATAVTANAEEGWSPFRFIEVSAQSAVEEPGEATTYVTRGRTRVNLPEEVVSEINAWCEAVCRQQNEWYYEDQDAGLDNGMYYGGWEEGFAYAIQTVFARLGYVDDYYMDSVGIDHHNEWISSNGTLETVEEAMDEAGTLDTFYLWEDCSFGRLAPTN